MEEKKKETVKMNLWTVYVLAVGILVLLVAVGIGGAYYYKQIKEIEVRTLQAEERINNNQSNIESRIDEIKQKQEKIDQMINN